jgi:hypothetical protein
MDFKHKHIYTLLTKYLFVADNATHAVFLHVSASSERPEWAKATGIVRKKKQTADLTIHGYLHYT